jgi:hypothetical protein
LTSTLPHTRADAVKPDYCASARRLLRSEWESLSSSESCSSDVLKDWQNISAILVLPSRCRHGITPELGGVETKNDLPFMRLVRIDSDTRPTEDPMLPPTRIPLYDGVALFSEQEQRSRLLVAMGKLLGEERRRKMMRYSSPDQTQGGEVTGSSCLQGR